MKLGMMAAVAATVALAVLAQPVVAAETPDPDTATLLSVAQLLQEHKAAEALERLAPMIEANERQIEAQQAKGLVFCATDMTEALSYSLIGATEKKSATVLKASVCQALYFKAFALNELGRRPEGIAMLERLVTLAPMHSQYFSELGYAYNASRKFAEAEKVYRKALDFAAMAPDEAQKKRRSAVAWRGIGYTLVEKGDWDGAEKAYRQSQTFEPDSPVAKQELDFISQKRPKAGS